MHYSFQSNLQNNETVLSISLLKSYLRIDHSQEDTKIQDIIDSVIEVFQQSTGYIFRPGTLTLTFSIEDNLSRPHRKELNFADRFVIHDGFEDDDVYSSGVSAQVEIQKPTSLSFLYNSGQNKKVLSADAVSYTHLTLPTTPYV